MPTQATWGDFEIHFDGVLGRGGMGSVYRAWQNSVGRWVAVKVLEPARAVDPELQQGLLQKFQIEIQALARLNDPRIVTIFQSGETEGRLWFAMELIDGETVEERLTRSGAFPEEEAALVGIEVARALDAALRQGIHHRDVKPANIFLLRDGSVKLADFGLARSEGLSKTRLTDLHAVVCTPEYASPEQASGGITDHRSDLYSLGCVLYEMVTERPPFAGDSPLSTLYKHAVGSPPSARLLNPHVSPEFEAVIRRCLEKNPEDRFQSSSELVNVLMPTEPYLEAARPKERSRNWLWTSAAAAGSTLLALILAAIFTAELPGPLPAEARPSDAPPPKPLFLPPMSVAPAPPRDVEDAPQRPLPKPDAEQRDAEALDAFRSSLPSDPDSELIAEIPWGTWRADTFHAPGGEARFDPAGKACVLSARLEQERAWIKRPFAGAQAGYQVRYRFLSPRPSSRFSIALSFTKWIELRPDGAALFVADADGALRVRDERTLDSTTVAGIVSVVPDPQRTRIYLGDRLLFSSEGRHADGIQLGAGGGSVRVESVRVKDRTR